MGNGNLSWQSGGLLQGTGTCVSCHVTIIDSADVRFSTSGGGSTGLLVCSESYEWEE